MIEMKRILLLSVFLTIALSGWTQSKKALYKAEWGVQTYTFRNHFPKGVLATLDTIKALGFTEIEGGAPKGVTPEAFKKACDERGLSIPSTGAGYDELVKDPEAVAARAKTLGAKYVMCAWIPHEKGKFNLENAKKAVDDFNNAGKVLKAHGLTFCYHDHGYEFQKHGGGTLMDYIIQNTDPKYVSFEMDLLWTMHGGGDPVALLKKYGKRWKLMHIKDLKKGITGDLTGGTPAENDVPVGAGQADMVNILKVANKIGIKHFFIEDESNVEMKQIPQSIAYLKSLRK